MCGGFGTRMVLSRSQRYFEPFRWFHIDSDENTILPYISMRQQTSLLIVRVAWCSGVSRHASNADNSIANRLHIIAAFRVRGKINPITARRMVFAIPFIALLARSGRPAFNYSHVGRIASITTTWFRLLKFCKYNDIYYNCCN